MRTKDMKREKWGDFWDLVPRGTEGCWEWRGPENVTINRPIYARSGQQHYAYRVAWVLTNGDIPDDLGVLHHCDNPMCCRPDHLFLGTQSDNCHDMWSKGRGVQVVPRYGHEHHMVRIPDTEVRAARERYALGGISIKGLAREVGTSERAVTGWLSGTTRLAAGGPINDHLRTRGMAEKLRQAKRRTRKLQEVAA